MCQLKVSPAELSIINKDLMDGVLNRATNISFIYMAVFAAYSVSSFPFIHSFDPSVTLFANTWPRILLNVLPLLLLYIFLHKGKASAEAKVWWWAVVLPMIFFGAGLVHVWRIMSEGRGDIYLYVHSANTFMIVTSIVVVAPPIRIIAAQMASYCIFLLLPIGFLLVSTGNYQMFAFSMADYFIAIPCVLYFGHTIHELRFKIAYLDFTTKKQATSFLGSQIAQAIYEDKEELLESRRVNAVVLKMDIRSFTDFYQANDVDAVRKFMTEYHSLVSREVGKFGGYWHKSVGDAHLVTFGAMDLSPSDLSDIPGIEDDLTQADQARMKYYARRAFEAVKTIVYEFEKLKMTHLISDPIRIGAALTYGDLEVRIQGDVGHKRELDIDGAAIIRCARLEEYTKVIRAGAGIDGSIMVLSQEFGEVDVHPEMKEWVISDKSNQVRNFPQLTKIRYRVFPEYEDAFFAHLKRQS